MGDYYKIDGDILTDIASAIRTKTGASETISPLSMASEIANLPEGGNHYFSQVVAGRDGTVVIVDDECSTINAYAFYNNKTISKAVFNNATGVNSSAFQSAKGDYEFPVCSIIDNNAFYNGRGNYVSFGSSSVRAYGGAQFSGALYSSISILGLTNIPTDMFRGCLNLKEVDFPNCSYTASSCFYNCTALSQALLSSCTSVGANTFQGCLNLTKVALGQVSYLGGSCFNGCYKLSDLTIEYSASKLSTIGTYAFQSCSSLASLGSWCNDVKLIDSYAFQSCISLSNIDELKNVTSIGTYAFQNCPQITSFSRLQSVISIGVGAFRSTGLTEIPDLNSVSNIGGTAFESIQITSAPYIPNTAALGASIFKGCYNLTDLTKLSQLSSFASSMFLQCSSLSDISCLSSATIFGDSCFMSCNISNLSLTGVSIGNYCFASNISPMGNITLTNCSVATNPFNGITVNNVLIDNAPPGNGCLSGITILSTLVFQNCSSLRSGIYQSIKGNFTLSLDSTNLFMSDRCFYGGSYTKVYCDIPTIYGGSHFRSAYQLTTATLGPNVSSIPINIFQDCSQLSSLYLQRSDSVYTYQGLGNTQCDPNKSDATGIIYVPAVLLSNYMAANTWSKLGASRLMAIPE